MKKSRVFLYNKYWHGEDVEKNINWHGENVENLFSCSEGKIHNTLGVRTRSLQS